MLFSTALVWVQCFLLVLSVPLEQRASSLPDLYEATIDELALGLDDGAFTSVHLVKAYLARIAEVDTSGAMLRAVIQTNPHALEQAAYCDDLRKKGTSLGPLHGIPVLVKDNINTDVSLGMNTTAGSYALINTVVTDSFAVKKLRDAGALILGKANLSQWAFWRSSNGIPSGWTSVGGQCTNAYYPGGNPSGSSGGSAVLTSVGLGAAALGSDTGGSVIYPASANNVVGLRPTLGLVSRAGVVPLSSRHDTLGPMGRTVKDVAYLLQAIAGPDSADNFTLTVQNQNVPDYLSGLTKDALKGARLGYPLNLNGAALDVTGNEAPTNYLEKMQETIAVLESLGATVIQGFNLTLSASSYLSNDYSNLLAADFKQDIAEYLATVEYIPSGVKTLADLIKFNDDHPDLERPPTYESEDLWLFSEATPSRNVSGEYLLYRTAQQNIDDVLAEHSLDALIFPGPQSTFSTIARYPQLVVPCGFLPEDTTAVQVQNHTVQTYDPFPGKPWALTFAGTGWSEKKLLAYGYAFEQATHHRLERKAYAAAIPKTQLADVM